MAGWCDALCGTLHNNDPSAKVIVRPTRFDHKARLSLTYLRALEFESRRCFLPGGDCSISWHGGNSDFPLVPFSKLILNPVSHWGQILTVMLMTLSSLSPSFPQTLLSVQRISAWLLVSGRLLLMHGGSPSKTKPLCILCKYLPTSPRGQKTPWWRRKSWGSSGQPAYCSLLILRIRHSRIDFSSARPQGSGHFSPQWPLRVPVQFFVIREYIWQVLPPSDPSAMLNFILPELSHSTPLLDCLPMAFSRPGLNQCGNTAPAFACGHKHSLTWPTTPSRLIFVLAPRWWNELHLAVQTVNSPSVFKQSLKTRLFTRYLTKRRAQLLY